MAQLADEPHGSMSGQRLARVYLQGEWRILVVTNMADDETGAPGVCATILRLPTGCGNCCPAGAMWSKRRWWAACLSWSTAICVVASPVWRCWSGWALKTASRHSASRTCSRERDPRSKNCAVGHCTRSGMSATLRAAPSVPVMLLLTDSCASREAPARLSAANPLLLGGAESNIFSCGKHPHLEGIQAERQASAARIICRPIGKRSHCPDLGHCLGLPWPAGHFIGGEFLRAHVRQDDDLAEVADRITGGPGVAKHAGSIVIVELRVEIEELDFVPLK